MLMKTTKQTPNGKGSNLISTASRVVISHKITSSVSAAAVMVAGSLLVTAHTSANKTHLQVASNESSTSQSNPEATDKNLLTVDVTTPSNDKHDDQGHTRIDVTPGQNTDASVSVNGDEMPTDNNGGVHQTIPNTTNGEVLDVSVDSHTESSKNSHNNTNSTLRISSSSRTSTHDSTSQTTQINGRTIK